MEEIVIIGGGIAGLACVNAFLDRGISPLLIEAGAFGLEKVCGEFISSQAVDLLEKWGITQIKQITHINLFANNKNLKICFTPNAGAIARSQAELLLTKRAQKKGARLKEQTVLTNILPPSFSNPYILTLASGEEIRAKTVIFATGKFTSQKAISPYIGLKTTFTHKTCGSELQMHLIKGAYIGIVPISSERSSCTGLFPRKCLEKPGFLDFIIQKLPLQDVRSTLCWQQSPIPLFGIKTPSRWPQSYFIGDSIASFPPASGYGFTHSLVTAITALEFFLQKDPDGYRHSCQKTIPQRMRWAQILHGLMQQPTFSSVLFPLLRSWPKCTQALVRNIQR